MTKTSNKQLGRWEKEDYEELLKHPAIELLKVLPHTKRYELVCLLNEVLAEEFDMGYKCGCDDGVMILRERLKRYIDEC